MQFSLGTFDQDCRYEPPHRAMQRSGVVCCDFLPFLLLFESLGTIAGECHGERRTHAEPVAPHGEGAAMRFADSA